MKTGWSQRQSSDIIKDITQDMVTEWDVSSQRHEAEQPTTVGPQTSPALWFERLFIPPHELSLCWTVSWDWTFYFSTAASVGFTYSSDLEWAPPAPHFLSWPENSISALEITFSLYQFGLWRQNSPFFYYWIKNKDHRFHSLKQTPGRIRLGNTQHFIPCVLFPLCKMSQK